MTKPCEVGDRIKLILMGDDPCPIPPGTTGTVRYVGKAWTGSRQIQVDWDIERSLNLVWPVDQFEVINE
jgi:hypothetical protein